MIPYRFHPAACDELEEAVEFYDARAEGLGSALLDDVSAAITILRAHPQAGARIGSLHRILLNRFPYSLYYRAEEEIEIVAMAHQSRRPRDWSSRS